MPAASGTAELRLVAVVTAAGKSERFEGGKKELASLGGKSVLDHALAPFLELEGLFFVVITAPRGGIEAIRSALSPTTFEGLKGRLSIVEGGGSRRDSVRLGLERVAQAVPDTSDLIVLVHDGARPWASAELCRRVSLAAARLGAAIPVVPLTDTPKRIGPSGVVLGHPPRASLASAQTPQGFRFDPLLAAHVKAAEEGMDCTDDAELWARYAGAISWVEGEVENRKVTYKADLGPASQGFDAPMRDPMALPFRIGSGWDLHRLSPGRRLMLGGLEIPSQAGEVAHSDGDVLLHAIIDAFLGAAALGDIGSHFPPTDPRWKDADSKDLARSAAALVAGAGWEGVNLDCTVILEKPRLGPHRDAIRASIARIFGMDLAAVSVKAKTKEGVDATGEGRAIEAYATVLMAGLPRPDPGSASPP